MIPVIPLEAPAFLSNILLEHRTGNSNSHYSNCYRVNLTKPDIKPDFKMIIQVSKIIRIREHLLLSLSANKIIKGTATQISHLSNLRSKRNN